MSNHGADCRCTRFVSLWVGTFSSLDAAEGYFGIPDEIGVYLPPERFATDLGLDEVPVECLEVNFGQLSPRPLAELLRDATYSAEFLEQAVAAANLQGIHKAQGIALLYDFDYDARPGWQRTVGPLRFIGSFAFVGASPAGDSEPRRDVRLDVREIVDDVL